MTVLLDKRAESAIGAVTAEILTRLLRLVPDEHRAPVVAAVVATGAERFIIDQLRALAADILSPPVEVEAKGEAPIARIEE